jgi:hypothetical protein
MQVFVQPLLEGTTTEVVGLAKRNLLYRFAQHLSGMRAFVSALANQEVLKVRFGIVSIGPSATACCQL